MPNQTIAAPSTQADPKDTAKNIIKGVNDRANGKVPAKDPETPDDADTKKPAAQADPNAGKKKYVVDGKEYWMTPEQADAYVQKGIAFEPRISEIARMRQEFIQLQQAMLADPGAILRNLAVRAKVPIQTLVEKVLSSNASDEVKEATGKWYWENVASRHRMDPKDRQILEQDERIKALEATGKARADAAVAAENKARVVKALGEISAQIKETLGELGIKDIDSAAGVRLTREIADVMRLSHMNRQPVTAKQAAEKVKARMLEYQKQFYDALDMDQLVETLGKENAEKVRKHFLKVVKEKEREADTPSPAKPAARRGERQTIGMDDFHDYLAERKKQNK